MIKAKMEINSGSRNKKEFQKNPEIDKIYLAKVNYFVEYE